MINTKNNGSKIRERLEKLSALRKIKPVDMTTLSQQVTVRIIFFLIVTIFLIIIIFIIIIFFTIIIIIIIIHYHHKYPISFSQRLS